AVGGQPRARPPTGRPATSPRLSPDARAPARAGGAEFLRPSDASHARPRAGTLQPRRPPASRVAPRAPSLGGGRRVRRSPVKMPRLWTAAKSAPAHSRLNGSRQERATRSHLNRADCYYPPHEQTPPSGEDARAARGRTASLSGGGVSLWGGSSRP